MFKLIKWMIIIAIVLILGYLWNFFWDMDKEGRSQIKKDVISAIESGDTDTLIEPWSDKIKEDLEHKKSNVFEMLKRKIKDALHRMIEGK